MRTRTSYVVNRLFRTYQPTTKQPSVHPDRCFPPLPAPWSLRTRNKRVFYRIFTNNKKLKKWGRKRSEKWKEEEGKMTKTLTEHRKSKFRRDMTGNCQNKNKRIASPQWSTTSIYLHHPPARSQNQRLPSPSLNTTESIGNTRAYYQVKHAPRARSLPTLRAPWTLNLSPSTRSR